MDKEHILAYWNLSRVIRTIPENAFEKDPNAAKLLEDYIYLEKEYISFLNYVNTKKGNEENAKGQDQEVQ